VSATNGGLEDWNFPPSYDSAYSPTIDQRHWFPVRETMDPRERDGHILVRIREVMTYA